MIIKPIIKKFGRFVQIIVKIRDEKRKYINADLSLIITSPNKKEYIFLPASSQPEISSLYPEQFTKFINNIGEGKYQVFFQPEENGLHNLKIFARFENEIEEKSYFMLF